MKNIKQKILENPPEVIQTKTKKYKLIGKCNDTLFLYEETRFGYKSAFDRFQLGMILPIEERLKNYAHRNNF